ncbi:Global transcription regulator sge1 [Oleoguttula sp. CCFEE 5521]
MSSGSAGPLVPTFHGFVHNSMDGLILFEACLSGRLHHVPRRPHDRERQHLIKSGSIFIYEENASGIKRWTDGVAWSPSRILGNFLIYRELEKPFPPGEKKRAMKRKRTSLPGDPYPRRESDETEKSSISNKPPTPPTPAIGNDTKTDGTGSEQDKELERALIGSLVDSYGFRPDGLVKKTMSISVNGISHHMVSYYSVDDVKNNNLPRPSSDARLATLQVRPELYLKQNFRAPIEENEHYALSNQMHAHPQMLQSTMQPNGYDVRQGQYYGGMYPTSYANSTGMYGAQAGQTWPAQQAAPASNMSYGAQQSYAPPQQAYSGYYKPSTQPPAALKMETSYPGTQSQSYSTSYASSYPVQQPQQTPQHAQQHQQTPQQQHHQHQPPPQQYPSTYGSMGGSISQQVYNPAHTQPYNAQQYPVRPVSTPQGGNGNYPQ